MAGTRIQKTGSFTANSGYVTKFTFSCWLKRHNIGSAGGIFASSRSDNWVNSRMKLYFNSSDQLCFEMKDSTGNDDSNMQSGHKLRDCNAWYHICLAWDATESTEADRFKLYVNGVNLRDMGGYASANEVGSGFNSLQDSNTVQYIGAYPDNSGNFSYFDGVMSDVHYTCENVYQASTFGETDTTTGIWKPKLDSSITYGTGGFHLKFENSSNMDLDSGTNNYTFTTNGTGLTQTSDCPSNNFCTWSKIMPDADVTIAYGGTHGTVSSGWKRAVATMPVSKGKWYWEIKKLSGGYLKAGMIEEAGITANMPSHQHHADNDKGWAWYSNDTEIELRTNQAVISGYSKADLGNVGLANNDVMCIALDLDNGRLHCRKNDGSWLKSGDPANNTGGYQIANWAAGKTYIPAMSIYELGSPDFATNFGNGNFKGTAITSAGTNASNLGSFEYDVPAGFTALCSKGLNE